MSTFPAFDQRVRVKRRMQLELLKTVLEAATPRNFIAEDWGDATAGGYGLDLDPLSAYWPEHWTAATIDALCPVLDAYLWRDLELDASIGGSLIAPFIWQDLAGSTDTTADRNEIGAGFLLVDVDDNPGGPLFEAPAISGGNQEAAAVTVSVTGRLPSRGGRFQADFYTGILARVFRRHYVKLSESAYLAFPGDVSESAPIVEDDGTWLTFLWEANCNRFWEPDNPFV